jgi:tRNA (guanine-N7-)-methyltransferase
MGRKNKLKKFADILSFPNVFECYEVKHPQLVTGADMQPVDMLGRWHSAYFQNDNPITLELACGGGEYTVALARQYPERNFIGVDLKGNRIWKGAKTAIDEGLANVGFVRTHIEVLDLFFAANEVAEIWITFADPFPRPGQENRRLTTARFNDKYRLMLKPGGLMHLKHDDPDFYKYSRKVVEQDPKAQILYVNEDIYAQELEFPELGIRTHYETKHLSKGRKIKYMRYVIEHGD